MAMFGPLSAATRDDQSRPSTSAPTTVPGAAPQDPAPSTAITLPAPADGGAAALRPPAVVLLRPRPEHHPEGHAGEAEHRADAVLQVALVGEVHLLGVVDEQRD